MKKTVSALLALLICLLAGAGWAEEAFFFPQAAAVGESVISSEELKEDTQSRLLRSALYFAAQGRDYDVIDPVTILDAMSKSLFDLEQREVIFVQALALGAGPLTAEEEAQAAREAAALMAEYRQTAARGEVSAHLPAGEFDYIEGDPEGNLDRYLDSWGLTEERLYNEIYGRMLEEKLEAIVAAEIEDEDEKIDFYTDWILARAEEAPIREDGLAAAEVALSLAGN